MRVNKIFVIILGLGLGLGFTVVTGLRFNIAQAVCSVDIQQSLLDCEALDTNICDSCKICEINGGVDPSCGDPLTHAACVDNSCQQVADTHSGHNNDQCSSDADCNAGGNTGGTTGGSTMYNCISGSCQADSSCDPDVTYDFGVCSTDPGCDGLCGGGTTGGTTNYYSCISGSCQVDSSCTGYGSPGSCDTDPSCSDVSCAPPIPLVLYGTNAGSNTPTAGSVTVGYGGTSNLTWSLPTGAFDCYLYSDAGDNDWNFNSQSSYNTPSIYTDPTNYTLSCYVPLSPSFAQAEYSYLTIYNQPTASINAVSVTPSSGSSAVGHSQSFTQVYSDSFGASDISQVWTFLRPSYAANPTNNACYLRYDSGSNSLFLFNDSGSAWSSGSVIGSGASLSNSQCTANVSASSVSRSGNNLTLVLNYTFLTPFIGSQQIWMYANNSGSGNSGWQQMGNWTVTTPTPTISLSPTSFSFSGVSNSGSVPGGQNLTITDSVAGTTLNWSATTTGPGTWCHVSPASGSAAYGSPSVVTVSVDTPSNVGSFTNCGIVISDPAASNSPQTAPVTYTVIPGPPGGSGGSPNITATAGSGAQCQTITVTWTPGSGASGYNVYRNNSNTTTGDTEISTNQTAQNGNTGNQTYPDPISGGPYYYWVESTSGGVGTGTLVAASNNSSGGVSANSCGPTPPTGGSVYNSGSNPPAGNPPGGLVPCGEVQLSWTDNSTNETGFKIYMNGIYKATAPASSPASQTGEVLTYDFTPPDNGDYNYSVAATNGSGTSIQVSETGNPYAYTSCAAVMTDSSKNIVAINGNAISPAPGNCNGFMPLPSGTNLNLGDKLSFRIDLCNDSPDSQATATNLSLTDNMMNLSVPKTGWNVRYSGTALTAVGSNPASGQYSVTGTAPNQTLTVNLNNYSIPPAPAPGDETFLTYDATIAVSGGSCSGSSRFQNSFNLTAGGGVAVPFTYPELQFYCGGQYPTINEVP